MQYKKINCFLFALAAILVSCHENTTSEKAQSFPPTPLLDYKVIKSFPHDTSLYTEGLFFHNSQLFESTGSPDNLPWLRSLIGIIDTTTGKMKIGAELDKSLYFGEGAVILNKKLYQLTYKNKKGFVYDGATFKLLDSFSYSNNEGWGLTTNGKDLIMSDGTSTITFIDPATLKPVKAIQVTEYGSPFVKLNELEYINGYIYANVWTTHHVVKIDPSNGTVVGRLDLKALSSQAAAKNPGSEVLNGIAFDSASGRIYVTGKLWPAIYQVKFQF